VSAPSPRVERALIAVSDKTGIAEFAAALARHGVEILSTGGTARTLRGAGIAVREVAEHTGSPEILGGRVKSLHPKIHGGILARRDDPADLAECARAGIVPIDLVVVNLYPFERRVAEGISLAEAIEEIDIGGPAMLRAAAKNHAWVTVVTDPADYATVLAELASGSGSVSEGTRRRLALAAYRRTAAYDAAISNWLGERLEGPLPAVRTEQWRKVGDLRYGENPHQAAAWYARDDADAIRLPAMTVHGGKALSYNNILDAAAAIECAAGLEGAAAVVVKHCLPCGAAERDGLAEAFEAALAGDPLSAFGGILALTRPLDAALAARIARPELFFEVIHAPRYLAGAIERLQEGAKWGRNCRILEGGIAAAGGTAHEIRSVPGALLVQEKDRPRADPQGFSVVTVRAPTAGERADLLFAWRVVPHVRSNGILLARGRAVVGAGAGQPSRVDSVAIAVRKAGERARGAALASDAFFPFPDGIEAAAEAGVTAVIQPGGSMRDGAVIEAANRAGIAMLFTGERHFKH
jgi:phosphoribosylaminoimidazolecarboxamide formyltransferase/IMP cyclohydrolase